MRANRIMVIMALSLLSGLAVVHGSGFGLYEHSAAAVAQAGAFSARADDVTAIYYNPAGLVQLEGTHFSLGSTLIMPKAKIKDAYTGNTYETKDHTFNPSTFFVGHKLNQKLALGFGVYNRFGLGMDWGDDYTYRYLVTRIDLKTYSFSPVVAYQLAEGISVGLGAEYLLAEVTWLQAVDMTPIEQAVYAATGMSINLADGHSRLNGDNGSGNWGFNVSFQGRFAEKYRVGMVYRSEMEVKFDGNIKFSDMVPSGYGDMIDAIIASVFINSKGTVTMNLPQSVILAGAMDVSDKIQVEFDAEWVDWSCYDKLELELENLGTQTVNKDWKAAICFRLGGQYMLNEMVALRAGYLYDQNPVPDKTYDTMLPDNNRHGIQIGAGYTVSGVTADIMYRYLFWEDRTSDHPQNPVQGKVENMAHLAGFQIGYKF